MLRLHFRNMYIYFPAFRKPSINSHLLLLLPLLQVSKLVEDISRLQAALSGVREATAAQMHAMEEQLEQKNRLIHRLEQKLEHSSIEEAKRDLQ